MVSGDAFGFIAEFADRFAPKVIAELRGKLDADGRLSRLPDTPSANVGAVKVASRGGGQVSPDGYSVNTSQPAYQPSGVPPDESDVDHADPAGTPVYGRPVPPQTARTIGDTLTALQGKTAVDVALIANAALLEIQALRLEIAEWRALIARGCDCTTSIRIRTSTT